MTGPAYPAARAAALKIYPHYAQHAIAGAEPGIELPDVETMEAMINVGFWTSLRREEIYMPRLSMAFVSPGQVDRPLVFERPVPFVSQSLTRLAPAVERPGIHLCVRRQAGDLCVWGATGTLPTFCFVLEVVAPGLLVVKHSRGDGSGKFINVAVLRGEEVKVVDQRAAADPDCPELLASLLGLQSQHHSPASVNVLIELAVSMRAHGHGGSLLVVPAGTQTWTQSILQPITYAVSPAFRSLVDLMSEDPGERARRRWQEALRHVIDGVAGLTAVDGATIITDQYELLAFGAKIIRPAGSGQVERIIVTEPIEGTVPEVAEPAYLGGTRHLSAAWFAHDQRDAIALVASQDGRFTVFGWSPCEQMVHAHHIETLLL